MRITHTGRRCGKTKTYIEKLEKQLEESMKGKHIKELLSKAYTQMLVTGQVVNPTPEEMKEAILKDKQEKENEQRKTNK